MARKGGKRGGSSAARSAAAKKGWETRRRGGAKAKPAATKRTAASKPRAKPASKPTARRGMPKTTSARGRALTNQRRAADLVRASRGGKGPSAKAVRSVLTAQRARAFYAATGGGKKRSAVKAKSAAKIGKSIRAQGRAKATAARAKVAGRPRAGATGAKTVLDQARWKRVVQRAKTRGEVRAYIEGKRPGGYNASTEKRVFAAYATRQRAEQFLLRLTRSKTDKSFQGSQVSGLSELNANFLSRGRGITGSTSIGVAARNRIYDEQRRAKRAENKAARERAAAAAAKPRTVQASRGRTVRLSPRGLLSGPRARLTGEGGMAMRRVLQSLPTIPRGRRPTSADSSGRWFDTSLSPGVRLGGRQRAALQTELERRGFSFRSNASGSVQTYSRQFATYSRNPRGQAEILTIQIQKSGKGGLSGGTVSAKRELFVDNRQRNVGGGLIERSLGLPRPRRSRTKPVRRR